MQPCGTGNVVFGAHQRHSIELQHRNGRCVARALVDGDIDIEPRQRGTHLVRLGRGLDQSLRHPWPVSPCTGAPRPNGRSITGFIDLTTLLDGRTP